MKFLSGSLELNIFADEFSYGRAVSMKCVLITVADMRILGAVCSIHTHEKEKLAHAHVEVATGALTHVHLHSTQAGKNPTGNQKEIQHVSVWCAAASLPHMASRFLSVCLPLSLSLFLSLSLVGLPVLLHRLRHTGYVSRTCARAMP